MWDSWDRNKQFEASYIPFEPFDYTQGLRLKFRLPKLRKGRLIFEGDERGRIVHYKLGLENKTLTKVIDKIAVV